MLLKGYSSVPHLYSEGTSWFYGMVATDSNVTECGKQGVAVDFTK